MKLKDLRSLPIKIGRHAFDRFIDWNISEEEATTAVRSGAWHPDGVTKWKIWASIEGRRIEVVVDVKGVPPEQFLKMVTVYALS